MKRPVEVVRLPRRHVPAPPSAPLPDAVQAALASIAGDLRHLPRDCIGDVAELLVWLRRMAGRIDGVGRMRVAGAVDRSTRISGPVAPVPPQPRDLAEAVFGTCPTVGRQQTRTVMSRRGRPVRFEVRRARAAGQMELW